MNNAKIVIVNIEEIPQQFYNKTYAYFSFSMVNKQIVALYLVDCIEDPHDFLIIDLQNLTPIGMNRFVKFLMTIRVSDDHAFGVELDLALAKKRFGIRVKRG